MERTREATSQLEADYDVQTDTAAWGSKQVTDMCLPSTAGGVSEHGSSGYSKAATVATRQVPP
ncbi:hypothetical protein CH063_03120 [Colletotrichum higginsianum]|uniref:Uncharacterized protein n=1 Tax=Colletotrichum higginsianum (strain IMI 349063) TaxID=759273 RepID=H1VTS6_COLHI|nr:hypothetical protein CH63R_11184 [Colletotrichum higginsianum IMI 349063]OBR04481.1 hypothetical protein CH63R_11184 [Colletotrichum higginsianum IMI 349063]CCF43634.1 hypothetical protein CH063_03120 [Colletotrichum higginsianum]